MDTKMELEDLMRRERRYWLRIDELVDKIKTDKNCPELEEDFRRLKFLLRKVKNTDDYEFHFNELCIENNQGNLQKLKTENTQKEAPETNAQASIINLTSAIDLSSTTTALTSPTNITVQSRSASAEKTTPKAIEKTAKKKKKYVRDFSSSDSESEIKIMPKPKRIKKDEAKRGRPKKKKAEYPRTTVGKFTSIPPLEDIPNSHENDEKTKQSPNVSPQRKISLKRLAKSTPEAEKEQTNINQSIYEIAKEILSSQSPTSETVKRKRGRPKGRKNTPKSDAPKSKTPKTPKSKRLAELQLENEKAELQLENEKAELQLENEKEELSDDDKPIVDIITKEFEDDLQNQASE